MMDTSFICFANVCLIHSCPLCGARQKPYRDLGDKHCPQGALRPSGAGGGGGGGQVSDDFYELSDTVRYCQILPS